MNEDELWEEIAKYPDLRLAMHKSPLSKWYYTTAKELGIDKYDYNHRDQFPDEIILDLDDTKEKNNRARHELHIAFRDEGISYSIWSTGGDGYHIHVRWKGLEKVSDIRTMKNFLADWLLGDVDVKIDRQLFGKHLVRREYGLYEKMAPKEQKYKHCVASSVFNEKNEIPDVVWKRYREHIIKYALRRMKPVKKYEKGSKRPKCVDFLLSTDFKLLKDGGKRAMFILTSYYRNLPNEELANLLKHYNKYNLKEPLLPHQIISTIRSCRRHKGRPVGCRYRHELLRDIGAGHIAEQCEHERAVRAEKKDEANTHEERRVRNND